MNLKMHMIFVAVTLAVAVMIIFGVVMYCRGRSVGAADNEVGHITQEIGQLEKEKDVIHAEAEAGDTIALRHRILRLSNSLGSRPRP